MALTALVRDLSTALHAVGKVLSIDVQTNSFAQNWWQLYQLNQTGVDTVITMNCYKSLAEFVESLGVMLKFFPPHRIGVGWTSGNTTGVAQPESRGAAAGDALVDASRPMDPDELSARMGVVEQLGIGQIDIWEVGPNTGKNLGKQRLSEPFLSALRRFVAGPDCPCGLCLPERLCCVCRAAAKADDGELPRTVRLASGANMPVVQLGTCCGSDPRVGLPPWVRQQKGQLIGIDTAWAYCTGCHQTAHSAQCPSLATGGMNHSCPGSGNVLGQPAIARQLKALRQPRSETFLITKLPTGHICNCTVPGCTPLPHPQLGPNATTATLYLIKQNMQELGVETLDLVLLHGACQAGVAGEKAGTMQEVWDGLLWAKRHGWARAIGGEFTAAQIQRLKGGKPDVNMGQYSLKLRDDVTLEYSRKHGIVYNAFGVIKGCNSSEPLLARLSREYNRSAAQVCAAWTRQRGCTMALGTGANMSTVDQYTREDLDVFFSLKPADMAALSAMPHTQPGEMV